MQSKRGKVRVAICSIDTAGFFSHSTADEDLKLFGRNLDPVESVSTKNSHAQELAEAKAAVEAGVTAAEAAALIAQTHLQEAEDIQQRIENLHRQMELQAESAQSSLRQINLTVSLKFYFSILIFKNLLIRSLCRPSSKGGFMERSR